jgi:hypothetical protein
MSDRQLVDVLLELRVLLLFGIILIIEHTATRIKEHMFALPFFPFDEVY